MILDDLLKPVTHEAVAQAVQEEKRIRARYGQDFVAKPGNTTLPPGIRAKSAQKTEVAGRVAFVKIQGKDMYGLEKASDVRYFECLNCSRKIAGSRFAAHMERCLNGRNSRNKGYVDKLVTYWSDMGIMVINKMVYRRASNNVSVSGSVSSSVSVTPSPKSKSNSVVTRSPAKRKKKLINAAVENSKRQKSEVPSPKKAVSKFFDRGKAKSSHNSPSPSIEWARVSLFFFLMLAIDIY